MAGAVIDSLRTTGDVNSAAIRLIHSGGVSNAAELAEKMMETENTMEEYPGIAVMSLGLADNRDELEPRIAAARGANKPPI